MANQIEINIIEEELSDADLMAVVGGISGQTTTHDALGVADIVVFAVVDGLDGIVHAAGKAPVSTTVGSITG